jgi:hypothetical protein
LELRIPPGYRLSEPRIRPVKRFKELRAWYLFDTRFCNIASIQNTCDIGHYSSQNNRTSNCIHTIISRNKRGLKYYFNRPLRSLEQARKSRRVTGKTVENRSFERVTLHTQKDPIMTRKILTTSLQPERPLSTYSQKIIIP